MPAVEYAQDLDWLAGVIDAEASFQIIAYRRKLAVCLAVEFRLSLTHEPSIIRITSILSSFGIRISKYRYGSRGPSWNEDHILKSNSHNEIGALLKLIESRLIVKGVHASLLTQFLISRTSGAALAHCGYSDLELGCFSALRRLNKRTAKPYAIPSEEVIAYFKGSATSELEARPAARPTLGWLAGFIDGDGAVQLTASPQAKRIIFSPKISISTTDPYSILAARELYLALGVDHTEHGRRATNPNHSDVRYTNVSRLEALDTLIPLLLPISLTKQPQLHLLHEFVSLRRQTDRYSIREFDIYTEMRELNQRGTKARESRLDVAAYRLRIQEQAEAAA